MLQIVKRGQVTVFVIIAIVAVVGIAGYFIVKNTQDSSSTAEEFSEVFSYYESCINQYTKTGISVAGSQGGWLEVPTYEAGSDYAPFGNQLIVAGIGIPYWMTITGNGLIKENVPSQDVVERQLNSYIKSRLSGCSMDVFREKGFEVISEVEDVQTTIASDGVLVKVKTILSVSTENATAQKTDFSVSVPTQFGTLLKEAQNIYDYEQESLFLENYSFDVLRLYAPVDGVDIKCAPSIWNAQDVFVDLQDGLSGNIQSLKFNKDKGYFNVDINSKIDSSQVIYDSSWPARFEVYGNEGNLLVAKPIGNEAGLSALGFCYVPYHFVYDMMFPVLFRLTDKEDIFQFPLVVVIDKNVPRNAIQSSFSVDYGEENDLCAASTNDLSLQVRDSQGVVSAATVSYKCFSQSCLIGETGSNGVVEGKVPACINGQIEINSPKHVQSKTLFSSHNSSNTIVYLEKEYPLEIKLLVDNKETKDVSFISFVGKYGSKQFIIPNGENIALSSGFYNVTVYQYGNTSIKIPASTSRQCVEVSSGGISGLFGGTKEQCFDISIPETTIDSALTAGGQGEIYLPQELLEIGKLTLSVQSIEKPTSIESLQTSYSLFETQGVDVIYE